MARKKKLTKEDEKALSGAKGRKELVSQEVGTQDLVSAVVELTDATVKSKYENNANTNAFTDALLTKLNGIETAATADQVAAEVPVTDTGGYFTATDVEGVLQEIGAGGGAGTDDQTAAEVPITDAGGYFTGSDVEAALQELGAGGGGGGVTRSVDTPAAIGSTSVKVVRLGGSAVSFGGSGAAGFTLDIPASTEVTQLDVTATNDTGVNASGEIVLAVDNSLNSYDRFFVYEIYDLSNDQKVDQHLTGNVLQQVVAGNVTTLTIPNIQGNYPNGFRLILR